jgi:superoxide dismutase, Cu-Zn family
MRTKATKILAFCMLSGVLISCQEHAALKVEPVNHAVALIMSKNNSQVKGEVVFNQLDNGVAINISLSGLSPGKHGFHIHTLGDARSSNARSAGGHYNPLGTQHASPANTQQHIGDLGNITANQLGVAKMQYLSKSISLNGPTSIIGRSVIIHQKADDFISQPSGAAGARIGQGIIGITL